MANSSETWCHWEVFALYKNMYKTVKARVRCGAKFTECFNRSRGVKHGDVLLSFFRYLSIN